MSSRHVTIVEVGPRDGLQNEQQPLSTSFKVDLITRLEHCGFSEVEVTSMVSPRWVPQLSDAAEVLQSLTSHQTSSRRTVLVPNLKGLERAINAQVQRVAIFIAASETFSQKNTNRSIAQSIEDTQQVLSRASKAGLSVRGYLSTAFVCPFEGKISPKIVSRLTRRLLELGCDQVSLGDTIGAATPQDIGALLDELQGVPLDRLALHLHDTYGTALVNAYFGLERGIRTFDASVGGCGGCPYAPGATGNLATEDLVHLLNQEGWDHGIDLTHLIKTAHFLEAGLRRRLDSHLLRVPQPKHESSSN